MDTCQSVALCHYHLRGGGVTRVLELQARSITKAGGRAVIIVGEEPPEGFVPSCPVAVVEGFGYQGDDGPSSGLTAAALATSMIEAARAQLGHEPALWHVHNHSLGKNVLVTGAVGELARQGRRLLLQLHDFAEDGRPALYNRLRQVCPDNDFDSWLYPQGRHVHYATLNDRDHGFLVNAGLSPSHLHRLANAAELDDSPAEARPELVADGSWDCLFVYPTRAIRRKNLGEFLLWVAGAARGEHYAVTLAPKNPHELRFYDRWISLAQRLGLPVTFEAGRRFSSLASLLATASTLITTSVAEGFGLCFIEPWLANRPLVGRDLPEVTEALKEDGLDLGRLYQRLEVPLSWVGGRSLVRRRVSRTMAAGWQAYGRAFDESLVEEALSGAIRDEAVDMGCLDEDLQERIVELVAREPLRMTELEPKRLSFDESAVSRNQALVKGLYSPAAYGERLWTLYERIWQGSAAPKSLLSAERLLGLFLSPQRFRLLRS